MGKISENIVICYRNFYADWLFKNSVSFKDLRLNVYEVENKQAQSLNNVLSMKTLKLT